MLLAMAESVKRQYRSPRREESARQTRILIREAAARLFASQGYAVTTMHQIAEEAGVSERTTYAVFPTKLDLFSEVIGVAVAGDDRPIPIAERPEFRAAIREVDGARALEIAVSFVSALLERAGALIMAAYESKGADAGLRIAAQQGEQARTQDLRLIAEALHQRGVLHRDLDVDQATDILLALASPHVHQIWRQDRKRSVEAYRSTLLTVLRRTLLKAPHEPTSKQPKARRGMRT
jgi:AcrR family transcriptional regulator